MPLALAAPNQTRPRCLVLQPRRGRRFVGSVQAAASDRSVASVRRSLGRSQLSGTIPAALGNLTQLQSLCAHSSRAQETTLSGGPVGEPLGARAPLPGRAACRTAPGYVPTRCG